MDLLRPLLFLACAALAAAPGSALPLPPVEEVVRTAEERALLGRLMTLAPPRVAPASPADAAARVAAAPFPSEHSRRQAERWQRLRADPKLRAAASYYGRLRSEPLNASAPPDPLPVGQTPPR